MTTATKAMLPIPQFFDPLKAESVWRVPYLDLAPRAEQWAKDHKIKASATDQFRICFMHIDRQNTFCLPEFELFVAGRSGHGAIDDSVRTCEFIYRNLNVITDMAATMDTHFATQIFHPIFWVDENGEHPAPFTEISAADVRNGKWRVNPAMAYSVSKGNYVALSRYAQHYVDTLERNGRYPLTVWPYHGMLGGIGHALVSVVEEACFFHNIARRSQTEFEVKGGNFLTENYSALEVEVDTDPDGNPIDEMNADFFERLVSYDAIIAEGEAASHCFAWTIDSLLKRIKTKNPELAKKVYLLKDCTSPVVVFDNNGKIVVDHTDKAEEAFDRFAAEGMNVVSSTDPIESWPGMEKLAA